MSDGDVWLLRYFERPEQLERDGSGAIRQECLCEFVENGTHVFTEEKIEAAPDELEESIAICPTMTLVELR